MLPVLFLIGLVAYVTKTQQVNMTKASHPYRSDYYAPSPPSPIMMIGHYLRMGQHPPPQVLMCAIAEAETIGREDIAIGIVQTFVAPTVWRHQAQQAQVGRARDANPRGPLPIVPTEERPSQRAEEQPEITDDGSGMYAIGDMADAEHVLNALARGEPVARPKKDTREPVLATATAVSGDVAMTPASPVDGVPRGAWNAFTDRLVRETPLFQTQRHVGQFRQNKERLAELGIDAREMIGSDTAQRRAFDADMADAYQHALEGGLINEHVRRLIRVPGSRDACTVTLSGLLGVIHAAGLEGAVSWFENPDDRSRFVHTTEAFLKANGAF